MAARLRRAWAWLYPHLLGLLRGLLVWVAIALDAASTFLGWLSTRAVLAGDRLGRYLRRLP